MEILVLGDSLPFGRPKYGICRHKTWPYLLQQKLNSLLCMRACGGSTSSDVLIEAQNLAGYWFGSSSAKRFDAAFVQVGIVDSCPRLLPRSLYPYASRVPGFARLERSKKLHEKFGKPWTSSPRFASNIASINDLLGQLAVQIFFVEIARPVHYLKDNVGDFSRSVLDRNRLISQCVGADRFVPCWGGVPVPGHLLPDGHHLNEKGHQEVARRLLENIS